MEHPLVEQLRFARKEFRRGIKGVTEAEAQHRFGPMNSISWNVGHMAWQEQRYWLTLAQGKTPRKEVEKAFRYGAPASTPPLTDTIAAWNAITKAADPWLDKATSKTLETALEDKGKPTKYIWGSLLLRMIYHYWYHNGENLAIRQNHGHTKLPDFVGDIDTKAPYRSR